MPAVSRRCQFMTPDDFALALRALGIPLYLDDAGVETPLGVEYAATTADGASVRVTRLDPALSGRLRDRDAFVRVVERHGYRGAGIAAAGLYIVELPPRGESLAQRMARGGAISPTALAPLAGTAAAALASYHDAYGAHGFVAPSTFLVDDAGAVALRWGGIVPALLAAGADPAALAGRFDAVSWFAPETLERGALDERSDLYALGATLYAAATGRPLFGGRTTATLMATVLTDGAATRASPAHRLTAAVLRAIEIEPADRWHDARQLHDAIVGQAARDASRATAGRGGCLGRAARMVIAALVLWRLTHYLS